jgi:hypothetical protein
MIPAAESRLILRTMTDQEMALAIGERFITLRHQRAAFVGVLSNCRTPDGQEIPFRKLARETLEGSPMAHSAASQTLSLRLLIEPQPDPQATLQALYRFVMGEVDEV